LCQVKARQSRVALKCVRARPLRIHTNRQGKSRTDEIGSAVNARQG
jgi:hypothetical protein